MPETAPQAPEPGKIEVPILDMPNREERRAMAKSGKDGRGNEIHPDSQKNLRNATLADLLAFGIEVNKANASLNSKMEDTFKRFGTEVDLRFTEVHWNFGTFLNFLGTQGILSDDFLVKFEEFKKKAEEDLVKAADTVLKKEAEKAPEAEEKKAE
ncbi:Uncharacterised protein [uncultured archaeon]|nr:Uncharacterised protein [uncultured archaeon]